MDNRLDPRAIRSSPKLDDVTKVDHISILLSRQSVMLLDALLKKYDIEHCFHRDVGVTVAYSYQTIQCYPFTYHCGEMQNEYANTDRFIDIALNQTVVDYHTDIQGNIHLVLLLPDSIKKYWEFYINNHHAEWSQGIYHPYIKINDTTETTRTKINDINRRLSTTSQSLRFDTLRFMRFWERNT